MSNKEHHEQTYASILKFYDFAEKLVGTVEHEFIRDPVAQLEFIEPLVVELEEATDLLAGEYRDFVRTGILPGVFSRKRIEQALGRLHAVIQTCKEQKSTSSKPGGV